MRDYKESGLKLRAELEYTSQNLMVFRVRGSTGTHTVIFNLQLRRYSCSCWGFTVHRRCKHIVACLNRIKYMDENLLKSLPVMYPDLKELVEFVLRKNT